MKNDISKYIREVAVMATSLRKIIEAAEMEPTISQEMREDLRWELARLSGNMADALAAMVAVNVRYTEDRET